MTIVGMDGRPFVVMPEWHKDIAPGALMQWCGHYFEFIGIDPAHDVNVVFFKYRGPTKARTKRCQTKTETKN